MERFYPNGARVACAPLRILGRDAKVSYSGAITSCRVGRLRTGIGAASVFMGATPNVLEAHAETPSAWMAPGGA
jgi:hypothetical protein